METFHDANVAADANRVLVAAGIGARRHRNGRRTDLVVSYQDRYTANQLLTSFKRKRPDRRRSGIRRDYDFLIFGTAIGASIGLLLVAVTGRLQMLLMAGGITLVGSMIGHLLDRTRKHSSRGRVRITIYEWLLGVAVLALLLAMPQLIKAIEQ